MAKKKELKAGTYYLKCRMDHPNGKYRVLGHVVERQCKKFELDEDDVKELQSPGASKWVIICDEKQAVADAKLFKSDYRDHVEVISDKQPTEEDLDELNDEE